MTYVLYHSDDLDGKCAAAIAKLRMPDVVCIPLSYDEKGQRPDLSMIGTNDTVYMLDFTLKDGDSIQPMIDLKKRADRFYWIDHHQEDIDLAKTANFHPPGSLDPTSSTSELTFKYLFPNAAVPESVFLVGRADIDDFDASPKVRPFTSALEARDNGPESVIWKILFGPEEIAKRTTDQLVEEGSATTTQT